ncbi:hypothetical protein RhiirA4_482040 [Rhizophagus irregularis]|uniref:Uncharacterized protein n=1 Tax=Rhizophagus irregularis TaxID=588596 RepID=A0A2I1HKE9_9GLOM|nr:hypothetical protein RhiirA4_482040 [Rhizophagus irregularis]
MGNVSFCLQLVSSGLTVCILDPMTWIEKTTPFLRLWDTHRRIDLDGTYILGFSSITTLKFCFYSQCSRSCECLHDEWFGS